MSDVDEIDAWLAGRIEAARPILSAFVMDGGDLNDPQYRRQLGEHDAYMRVRSFISGARRASHPTH